MSEMSLEEATRRVTLKFTSGNSIPIERAVVVREEWDVILAALVRLNRLEARKFPIMDGPDIPWMMIAPYERQAQVNHSQSLERLAQRGGLSMCEAVAIMEARSWRKMVPDEARRRLLELTNQFPK